MKRTMSAATNKEELKDMIMFDEKMTDMEKLRDIFAIDKEKLKGLFPQLYYVILDILDKDMRRIIERSGWTEVR